MENEAANGLRNCRSAMQGPGTPRWDVRNRIRWNVKGVTAFDGLDLSDHHRLAICFDCLHSVQVSMKDQCGSSAGAVPAKIMADFAVELLTRFKKI